MTIRLNELANSQDQFSWKTRVVRGSSVYSATNLKKKLNKLHIEIESKCKYSKTHIEISTQHVSTKQTLFESARALKSRKI